MPEARTLFSKIWDSHIVRQEPGSPAILYIDLHLVHEVTSPQAFDGLRQRGLKVRQPGRTAATLDHSVPTLAGAAGRMAFADPLAVQQVSQLERNCREFGIPLFGLDHPSQGIVHIIGPELGLTQPGMTIVCGDSHTATHGAFGALAFGIGSSEVENVLATQCLLQQRPLTCQVEFQGALQPGVTAKDMILALIAKIGTGGGTGCVFEYCGPAVRSLDMEARMTLCNMSIEAGARAGLVAPDDTTYAYLYGREYAPRGREWDAALLRWSRLPSDDGASFDRSLSLDVSALEPMITFGTHPGMGIPLSGRIPDPRQVSQADQRRQVESALAYMQLNPGDSLLGHPLDAVFIGSCTNGRISDLRQAAQILRGRRVAPGLRVLVVPGSQQVKRQAELEGLDQVFLRAGAEWRQPGCSMCIGMNGDHLSPGQYALSTSNRNFEGRQGKGSRTFLASPLTAAAAAVNGSICDPRPFLANGR
jgi:3-isopropylmalate/(R)-2-methylmalate dehydratase large subunit